MAYTNVGRTRTQTTILSLALVALLVPAAHAGLFRNSVDLADLAAVPTADLTELKEPEFAVLVAEVELGAAKAAERRAAGGVKAAESTLEAEEQDLKAANAEVKAAKANNDDQRLVAANARVLGAKEDLETAKALRRWKQQERKAGAARVDAAKAALDQAEAQRDLARAVLLIRFEPAAAEKYDVRDLEKTVGKRQKEVIREQRTAAKEFEKIAALEADYKRLARNAEPFPAAITE